MHGPCTVPCMENEEWGEWLLPIGAGLKWWKTYWKAGKLTAEEVLG